MLPFGVKLSSVPSNLLFVIAYDRSYFTQTERLQNRVEIHQIAMFNIIIPLWEPGPNSLSQIHVLKWLILSICERIRNYFNITGREIILKYIYQKGILFWLCTEKVCSLDYSLNCLENKNVLRGDLFLGRHDVIVTSSMWKFATVRTSKE